MRAGPVLTPKAAETTPSIPGVAVSLGVADPPADWQPAAMSVSLGLGALLVMSGFVLKFRR